MGLDCLAGKIKNIFRERALSDGKRDALEQEIQRTASMLGFTLKDERDGMRSFRRAADGTTVNVPTRENLTSRDYYSLHNFDGYL